MKNTKITCDSCGSDITNTDEMPDYRLMLKAEAMTHQSAVILDCLVEPPISRDHYFCGMGCLAKWIKRKIGA